MLIYDNAQALFGEIRTFRYMGEKIIFFIAYFSSDEGPCLAVPISSEYFLEHVLLLDIEEPYI